MKKAATPAAKTTPPAKGSASKPGASKYKLTYFDGRGRGELLRLLLKVEGAQFEDVRVKMEDWPKLKPSKQIYLFLSNLVFSSSVIQS